jgi:hypothetical protein
MYPDHIFGLIIRDSMPNQLSVIPTPLKRGPATHIHKLDPDSITINRYESLLGAPLQVIGHISEFNEFPTTRRLVLLPLSGLC